MRLIQSLSSCHNGSGRKPNIYVLVHPEEISCPHFCTFWHIAWKWKWKILLSSCWLNIRGLRGQRWTRIWLLSDLILMDILLPSHALFMPGVIIFEKYILQTACLLSVYKNLFFLLIAFTLFITPATLSWLGLLCFASGLLFIYFHLQTILLLFQPLPNNLT